ncbi:glycosyltransferase family 2 protein [Pedobacter sp. Du54]|uniref:glycosyltransferase family 2 protein n=1 Tax=Pedobacter anseongensis TaxID=3133439 RepID=UPI00309FAF3F
MEKGVVSIIVPTFNRAHLLPATLNSILSQTWTSWECLIIDDGSSDNTVEVVKGYIKYDARFKYFKRPENLKKGAPTCRNFGFEMSSGEYIQWFDSDDLMLPDMLEKKVQTLQRNPEIDFMVAKMGEFTVNDKYSYPQYELMSNNLVEDYLLYKIHFLTPGPLFNRTYLAQQQLLFDINLVKHQEWEFYSRLILNGSIFVVLDDYLCLRRMHDESIKSITNKLGSNVRQLNKFDAIMALNRNTGLKYKKIIRKLFYKRIFKAMVRAILEFEVRYSIYFFNTLTKLI